MARVPALGRLRHALAIIRAGAVRDAIRAMRVHLDTLKVDFVIQTDIVALSPALRLVNRRVGGRVDRGAGGRISGRVDRGAGGRAGRLFRDLWDTDTFRAVRTRSVDEVAALVDLVLPTTDWVALPTASRLINRRRGGWLVARDTLPLRAVRAGRVDEAALLVDLVFLPADGVAFLTARGLVRDADADVVTGFLAKLASGVHEDASFVGPVLPVGCGLTFPTTFFGRRLGFGKAECQGDEKEGLCRR